MYLNFVAIWNIWLKQGTVVSKHSVFSREGSTPITWYCLSLADNSTPRSVKYLSSNQWHCIQTSVVVTYQVCSTCLQRWPLYPDQLGCAITGVSTCLQRTTLHPDQRCPDIGGVLSLINKWNQGCLYIDNLSVNATWVHLDTQIHLCLYRSERQPYAKMGKNVKRK